MEIRKRNGAVVAFCDEKIILAMEKAFLGQNQPVQREELAAMLQTVVQRLPAGEDLSVERVQDEVERALMERGHYAVAKAYILYREKRSELRRVRESLAAAMGDLALAECLRQIQRDFDAELYPISALQVKFESFSKQSMQREERYAALVKAAVELTAQEAPRWELIEARFLNFEFRRRLAREMASRGITGFYDKLVYLTREGLYGE